MKRNRLLLMFLTIGVLFTFFGMTVYAAEQEPATGSYHAASNEVRLNREEPSEGYDPVKVTRLEVQKQDNAYKLILSLETLQWRGEAYASVDGLTGDNEFKATIKESPLEKLPVGTSILFANTGEGTINLRKIDIADGTILYGGAYKKAIYSVDKNLGSMMTREEAYEIIDYYLNSNQVSGYWLEEEDGNQYVLTVWEHWPTGSKGKITMDLYSGNCYEEAPYWGVGLPYSDIPLEKTLLFNAYDYCSRLRGGN